MRPLLQTSPTQEDGPSDFYGEECEQFTSAALPVILLVVGVAMLGVSGWLRGEMVCVNGAAVELEKAAVSQTTERERAT